MGRKPLFIAEVKTQSPFGFSSDLSWDELFELANEYGDWISIHDSKPWGGSYKDIEKARALTHKPILAKGFHLSCFDVRDAFAAGADYVLTVDWNPSDEYNNHILFEPSSLWGVENLTFRHNRVVWNAREPLTNHKRRETFDQARRKWDGWLCQASFIRDVSDIHPGADAILVGSYLPEFIDSLDRETDQAQSP